MKNRNSKRLFENGLLLLISFAGIPAKYLLMNEKKWARTKASETSLIGMLQNSWRLGDLCANLFFNSQRALRYLRAPSEKSSNLTLCFDFQN